MRQSGSDQCWQYPPENRHMKKFKLDLQKAELLIELLSKVFFISDTIQGEFRLMWSRVQIAWLTTVKRKGREWVVVGERDGHLPLAVFSVHAGHSGLLWPTLGRSRWEMHNLQQRYSTYRWHYIPRRLKSEQCLHINNVHNTKWHSHLKEISSKQTSALMRANWRNWTITKCLTQLKNQFCVEGSPELLKTQNPLQTSLTINRAS